MPVYAASSIDAVTLSVEGHGGCGQTHRRPVEHGAPAKIWPLNCPQCENHLRSDPLWSATIAEIPETHDERVSREDFDKRGAKDKDAILTLALARLAGIGTAELPESLTRMISGVPAHIPGQVECPQGHAQPAGQKFCGQCGSPMSAPVAKASLPAAEPPQASPAAGQKAARPPRLRDQNKTTLKALCASRGLDGEGSNAELVSRLAGAGVTNNDLAAFLDAA